MPSPPNFGTAQALLSALAAVGRIYVSPVAGVLTESIGWQAFYLFSVFVALPGVVMVWWMKNPLGALSENAKDSR